MLLFLLALPLLAVLSACSPAEDAGDGDNPILAEWDTPFGVPPFDQIREEHYLPAFREAMAEQKVEVQAVIDNPEAPTFANTIEALERTGKQLTKASNAFFPVRSAHSNEEIRAIAAEIAPELAAHRDDIGLNSDLYARVKPVYDQR